MATSPAAMDAVFGKSAGASFRRGEISGRELLRAGKPITDEEFDGVEAFMGTPARPLKSHTTKSVPTPNESEFLSQLGVPIVKTAAENQQKKIQAKSKKWVNREGRLVSVEEIAGEWYQSRGYSVLLCEGKIISVWVATFLASAVQDRNDPRLREGFRTTTRGWRQHRKNPQRISIVLPDDFASASYYQRREDAIQSSIQRMRSTENLGIMFDGLLNSSESLRDYLWVNDDEPVEAARIALNIVPREMVIACVVWAIKHFWQRRRGWPDLFVYTADSFVFSEVKAPHDHLSPEQMNWFRWAITGAQIPCELCRVERKGEISESKP
jgi:hypothetical protein